MRAAVITRYGSPEVLEITEVPTPIPGDNEVLVRIHASTVCFGDWFILGGSLVVRLLNGLRRPRIHILGVDFAGRVESIGKAVTRFAPGDEGSVRVGTSSARTRNSLASPKTACSP